MIEAVGIENAKKVISMRRRLRELIALVGGKAVHPVFGLAGRSCQTLYPRRCRVSFKHVAEDAVEFATFTLRLFDDVVLSKREYLDLITSDDYTHRTYLHGAG